MEGWPLPMEDTVYYFYLLLTAQKLLRACTWNHVVFFGTWHQGHILLLISISMLWSYKPWPQINFLHSLVTLCFTNLRFNLRTLICAMNILLVKDKFSISRIKFSSVHHTIIFFVGTSDVTLKNNNLVSFMHQAYISKKSVRGT